MDAYCVGRETAPHSPILIKAYLKAQKHSNSLNFYQPGLFWVLLFFATPPSSLRWLLSKTHLKPLLRIRWGYGHFELSNNSSVMVVTCLDDKLQWKNNLELLPRPLQLLFSFSNHPLTETSPLLLNFEACWWGIVKKKQKRVLLSNVYTTTHPLRPGWRSFSSWWSFGGRWWWWSVVVGNNIIHVDNTRSVFL